MTEAEFSLLCRLKVQNFERFVPGVNIVSAVDYLKFEVALFAAEVDQYLMKLGQTPLRL